jgi:hypothetical protein
MDGYDSIFLYECGLSFVLYIRQGFLGRVHILVQNGV